MKACVNLLSFSVRELFSSSAVFKEENKHKEQMRALGIMNCNDFAKHFDLSQILII